MFQYWRCVPGSRQSPYWWAPHLTVKASKNYWLHHTLLQPCWPQEQTIPSRVWCWSPQSDRRDGCRSIQRQPVTHPGSSYRSCARKTTGYRAGGWSYPSPAIIWSLHLLQPSGFQVPREPFSNPTLSWALKVKTSCLFFWCLLLLNVLENVDWLFAAWLHLHQTHPLDLLQTVLLWGMNEMYLFGSSGNTGGNC